jgi:hypothetical protein
MRGDIMGAPYSDDLRSKFIQACERRRESQREIVELFSAASALLSSSRSGSTIAIAAEKWRHCGAVPGAFAWLAAGAA